MLIKLEKSDKQKTFQRKPWFLLSNRDVSTPPSHSRASYTALQTGFGVLSGSA